MSKKKILILDNSSERRMRLPTIVQALTVNSPIVILSKETTTCEKKTGISAKKLKNVLISCFSAIFTYARSI